MSKSIAPNELTKDELIEYLSGRKKHTTPVQRRSRRHFEEELCFFEERMARWMGCGENGRVGSNTDFADLFHPEDQETVMMIHHSWFGFETSMPGGSGTARVTRDTSLTTTGQRSRQSGIICWIATTRATSP